MEAVKAFNLELSSLYEVKPPISKAKMTALTRGAIKAIKFYKHVVQSVEKFILKCKPEYKVPGLYVIDSIVRQSRHQFGPEKDVFAPRFTKNLQQTFVNLFKCPPEDKSKIIRVLNLWQKNQVFPPEVIQPLFDLADPNNPIYQQIQMQQQQQQQQQQSTPVQQTNGSQGQVVKGSPALQRTPTKVSQGQSATIEAPASNLNLTEPVLQQLQQLQRLLTKGADASARPEQQVHFDKKLLDFDYDEDEEEVNPSPRPPPPAPVSTDPVASLLTNPEVLRQLQTLQNTLAGAVNPPPPDPEADRYKKLQEMKMQEDEFDKHLAQTVPNLPFAAECEFNKISQSATMIGGLHFIPPQPENAQMGQGFDMQLDNSGMFGIQNNTNDVEVITLDHDDSPSEDDRFKRKRSRSRSRDRGRDKDRRRRSKSRSRSRSRTRRHRSKSKERKEKEKRDKEKDTEKEKERKKRGLPPIKKENLSVCSTTLWVGHLSKLVHQDDLSNTFGEFGDIVSINLIIPRGCAFIMMHRRQDAARCLSKLKNYNLHGKAITLAWAPGKGVKGKDLKDYWEGDLGVSYIPWNKLKEDMDLEALEDGGMIDEDTMPDWMRKKMEESSSKKIIAEQPPFLMGVDTSQPPPLPPSGLMQPPMLSMVNPFQLNNRFLGMLPNMANLTNMPNLPLGVPPPNIAPPNMPPSMMPNLGLGLSSPFQGPPGFIPPALPPPQHQESKPAPPPNVDAKLRNLSESLMNLAGQPLSMPPQLTMNQPPPPIHNMSMDESMDVEMEDAAHPDLNKPPPNMGLSDHLQGSMNSSFGREGRRDESRFSPPGRRDRDRGDSREGRGERSGDRNRRRSRSRDRDNNRDRDRNDRGRDRDRRDKDREGRDYGRGGRDRDRDREGRDRRGNDRDRVNRWGPQDRRDERPGDRRDTGYDRRRDGPQSRRDGNERRDESYDRRDGARRDDRRDVPDTRDKAEREKTLTDRLKEMAGMKFEEPSQSDRSPRSRRPSDVKEGPPKDVLCFEPPPNVLDDSSSKPVLGFRDVIRSPGEARNPSPPDFSISIPPSEMPSQPLGEIEPNPSGGKDIDTQPNQESDLHPQQLNAGEVSQPLDESYDQERSFGGPRQFVGDGPGPFGPGNFGPNGPGDFGPDRFGPRDFGPDGPGDFGRFGPDGPGPFGADGPESFGPEGPGSFGPDGPGPFGPDGPGPFGPDDRFGNDGHRFRGPPFGDDGYGPPPDLMMEPGFGPPGFDGPPFDGPPFDGPPFDGPPFDGPPERFMRGGRRGRGRGRGRGRDRDMPDFFPRDDFGPPMDEGFGPPMRDDFGPPPMLDEFGQPMRDDFGPPMRGRGRGRGFFGRGRGRGGMPPFGDGFNPDFDGGPPHAFFRGGPRGGRPFGDGFPRGGRGRGFRGGRGRPDFFDGPPQEFFDGGAPHDFFEGGPPGFEIDGPPEDVPIGLEGRRGRGRRRSGRSSRWGENEGDDNNMPGEGRGEGGATPLRDEIDDCGPQMDYQPPAHQDVAQEAVPPPDQEGQDSAPQGENNVGETSGETQPAE